MAELLGGRLLALRVPAAARGAARRAGNPTTAPPCPCPLPPPPRRSYYWITGRVDDVINVSGHRIGTAEVESALVGHHLCAEAAVVPVDHPIKGQVKGAVIFWAAAFARA